MEPPKSFDEIDVALQLLGSISEQVEGMKRMDQEYRPRVFAHLRAHFPRLTPQDLENSYRHAIADFAMELSAYHRDQNSSNFDPNQPLLPFLKTIAYRRTVDLRRRACVRDKAIRALEETLRAGGGFLAREGPKLVEREEFRAVVYEAIARLPCRQRVVWGAIVDLCLGVGSMPSDEELRDYLSERTAEPWTMAAVRGGKRNGKDALREQLKSKGFEIDW